MENIRIRGIIYSFVHVFVYLSYVDRRCHCGSVKIWEDGYASKFSSPMLVPLRKVSNEKIFVLEDWFFLPMKYRNWKEKDLWINGRQIFLAWWANDRFVFIDSILSLDETFWRVEKRIKSEQILRHSLDRWINLIEKWVLFVVRTSFIEWSLKPLHWNSPQIISSFILIVNGEQVYLEWSRFVDSPRCHLNDSFFSKELKSKENSFIEQFIERLNLIRRLNLFQSLAEFISMADEPSEPSFVFHFVFFASTHQSTHAKNDGCSARITNHSILGK